MADGYCVAASPFIDIFDSTGKRIKEYNVHDWLKLDGLQVQSIVEVPAKGVYALIGYQDSNDKGRAELVRLDGVD